MLPRHARCVLSRFRCNGHSLLLNSYLSKIGRIENPFCSACGHPSQDTSHLILYCPSTDSLRRLLFDHSLSLYDLWSRPWRAARLLGFHSPPPCVIPRKESGSNNNTSPTSGNGQNFFAKLLFKSSNLCGSGSGRIFALPLPPLPASAFTSLLASVTKNDFIYFFPNILRVLLTTFILRESSPREPTATCR